MKHIDRVVNAAGGIIGRRQGGVLVVAAPSVG